VLLQQKLSQKMWPRAPMDLAKRPFALRCPNVAGGLRIGDLVVCVRVPPLARDLGVTAGDAGDRGFNVGDVGTVVDVLLEQRSRTISRMRLTKSRMRLTKSSTPCAAKWQEALSPRSGGPCQRRGTNRRRRLQLARDWSRSGLTILLIPRTKNSPKTKEIPEEIPRTKEIPKEIKELWSWTQCSTCASSCFKTPFVA
jgi:hypothetical protein